VRRSHQLTVVALLAMLVLSLLSSGYLLFSSEPRLSQYVDMTRRARDAHEAMLDQETGLRGWMATGDRVFLQPFDAGQRTARSSLEVLLASSRHDAEVSDAVVAMLRARARWDGWAARAVAMTAPTPAQRADGELTASLLRGKHLFDVYRAAEARSTGLIRTRRMAALDDQRDAMVLVLALYLGVLGGTFALVARRRRILTGTVLRPVDGLLRTIESMGHGDLRARSTCTGVQELDKIGTALDDLATELDRARAEARVREERLSYLASRFETVVSVGREIAGSLSERYVAESVTSAAADLLQAPAVLWGRDVAGDLVVTRRSADPHSALPPHDVPAPELVLTTAADAQVGREPGRRAYPLVLGGTVVGVLETATDDVDKETGQVLEALLSTAAAALESARLHSATRQLADLDALTGLPNRRRFEADLDAEWERCSRYGRPLSLVMLDLDHFKSLNDRHGHLFGDQVLRAAAEAIGAVLRSSDTAYRYGGEEFVVLLRETALEDALEAAERIRAATAAIRVAEQPEVRVTCSAGIAERRPGMRRRHDLVASADGALYDAKRGGRDRVAGARATAPVV
jgi:diguanylate cyclase (GGDEF)-like protein